MGAKSIVCQNKQLRTEMKELERELESLQGQNNFMVRDLRVIRHKELLCPAIMLRVCSLIDKQAHVGVLILAS